MFISFCLSLTGYDARTMSLTGYDTRICVAQKMAQGSWVRRSVSVPFGPFEKMMACYLLELMQSSFYGTPLKYFFFVRFAGFGPNDDKEGYFQSRMAEFKEAMH